MTKSLNPKPLAATMNGNVENEQDTPKSQLIKEWVCAMEDNMSKKDVNAGVTLYCIRCKNFDPSAVVGCAYNGCALHPFRCKALRLDDEEPSETNVTVELELGIVGLNYDQLRQMEKALRNVKVYSNDERICLAKNSEILNNTKK